MEAELFDSRELIKTDDNFTSAVPIEDLTNRLISSRVRPRPGTVAILQGFIASTTGGATTTLGRGGSDYTATIVGAALRAEEVQIWTDVTGIMTSDPRIVEERPHHRQDQLPGGRGARVLRGKGDSPLHHPARDQPRDPRLGEEHLPPGRRRNRDHSRAFPGSGLKAIACKKGITLVSISSSRMLLAYGFLRRIFEIFEKYQTPVDLIATSEVSVSVTIDNAAAVNDIARDLSEIGTVGVEADKSIICLVGQDLWKDTAFLARVFASLKDTPVRMISLGASDINLSFVVPADATEESVRNLHDEFFEG